MKKKIVALIAVILIVIVAVSAGLIWLTEANITYAFNVDYVYQQDNSQWVTFDWINKKQMNNTFITVECGNNGYFEGNFNLIVTFTNATFSTSTTEPYQQINSTAVKVSYHLKSNEKQTTDIQFTINDNVKSFKISLLFESNQFFVRSREGNWLGVNTLFYEYLEGENRFAASMIQ